MILCSGGFDPLHVGHLHYLQAAATYDDYVVVVLNSDAWLIRKKGYVFMPFLERAEILKALSVVTHLMEVDDSDGTVCEALTRVRPHYFANGGDRTEPNPAEDAVCGKLGIIQLFRVGGTKIASSSQLLRKVSLILSNYPRRILE